MLYEMSGYVKYETLDPSKLKALLGREDIDEDQKTNLRKMQSNLRGSRYKVKYSRSSKVKHYGRRYADKGFQPMEKRLRHTLAQDNYVDVDIVNAHPVILRQFLAKYDTGTYEKLTQYVEERAQVLKMLGKKEVLSILNGQLLDTTIRHSEEEKWSHEGVRWAREFHAECDAIRDLIYGLNLPIVNHIKTKDGTTFELKKSCVSHVI